MTEQGFKSIFYKINQVSSIGTGIWPHQKRIYQYICSIIIYSAVVSSCVFQFARIILFFSFQTIMDQCPFILVAFGTTVKHLNYIFNGPRLKKLILIALKERETEREGFEAEIMKEYAIRGSLLIKIYTAVMFVSGSAFSSMPFLPIALNIITPYNLSRKLLPIYPVYYFANNADEYSLAIVLYTLVTLWMTMMVFVAIDTTVVYLVQHACGLLAIAAYRFKHALDDVPNLMKDDQWNKKTYGEVCLSIAAHNDALQYLRELESCCARNLLAQVALIIISFSITLLKVSSITLSLDTYQYYGFLVAQFTHAFFITLQGQYVIDSHDNMYRMVYEAHWYNVDPKVRSMYALVQRQNLTPPMLTAGGRIQLNLDTFAEILKTSVSYFTVLQTV